MGNSLHCILKNKVVWFGFLFCFYITLNDKIKILPLEGSDCFIALVQLPLRVLFFFFSLSELVTLQMRNANTMETIWRSYVVSFSSSPPVLGEEQCSLILEVCQDVA